MARPGLNWRVILALLLLRIPGAGAGARRGARRRLLWRPSVEHGQPRLAQLGKQRRAAVEPQPAAPQVPSQPGFAPGPAHPGYGGSFFQRHPFLTGLAGGLFGSWLFGHSAAEGRRRCRIGDRHPACGSRSSAGSSGSRCACFAARRECPAGPAGAVRGRARRGAWRRAAAPAGRERGRDVNLADADLQSFQRLHAAIQEAWSAGDLARLRPLMTPEMLSYFSEELTRNTSRGVRNVVSDVRLVNGELTESWEERDRQFATAFLRWRAIDYVVRLGALAGEPRRDRRRRSAGAGRGRGNLDLCGRAAALAALGDPAGLTRATAADRGSRIASPGCLWPRSRTAAPPRRCR